MKSLLSCFGSLFVLMALPTSLCGHSPSQSHATLKVEQNQLIFSLEIPWSIAEGVKKEFREAKQAHAPKEFLRFVESYLTRHVEVREGGKAIAPVKINHLAGAHSHSATVELRYPIQSIDQLSIKNTVLFNLNSRQKNHHQVVLEDGSQVTYTTSASQTSFTIGRPVVVQASFPILRFLFLIGPAFVILGMAYRIDQFPLN